MSLLRIRTINRVSLWEIRERAFPNDRVFDFLSLCFSLSLSFCFQDGTILCYTDLGYNRIFHRNFYVRPKNISISIRIQSRIIGFCYSKIIFTRQRTVDWTVDLKFPSRLIGNVRKFRKDFRDSWQSWKQNVLSNNNHDSHSVNWTNCFT